MKLRKVQTDGNGAHLLMTHDVFGGDAQKAGAWWVANGMDVAAGTLVVGETVHLGGWTMEYDPQHERYTFTWTKGENTPKAFGIAEGGEA